MIRNMRISGPSGLRMDPFSFFHPLIWIPRARNRWQSGLPSAMGKIRNSLDAPGKHARNGYPPIAPIVPLY